MNTTETIILGFSKIHVAIVAVKAKGKRPTKTGADAAMKAAVFNTNRYAMKAEFSRTETINEQNFHIYLVSYVRPVKG